MLAGLGHASSTAAMDQRSSTRHCPAVNAAGRVPSRCSFSRCAALGASDATFRWGSLPLLSSWAWQTPSHVCGVARLAGQDNTGGAQLRCCPTLLLMFMCFFLKSQRGHHRSAESALVMHTVVSVLAGVRAVWRLTFTRMVRGLKCTHTHHAATCVVLHEQWLRGAGGWVMLTWHRPTW